MSVPAVLRRATPTGVSCAGRDRVMTAGRYAGLMVAVLLLAGCPGNTLGPTGGLDPTTRVAVVPPVPKSKPAYKPADGAAPTPVLPMPEPGPPVTSADFPPAPIQTVALPAAGMPTGTPGTANAAPSATPNADPDALVGLDEVQTLHLLGSPVAREEAPPAKIWRYSKGDCTLKVFFFMDMTSSQDFRALSYDMKSSQNVPDADHRCFAQLLAQADVGRVARPGIQ